VNGEAFTDVLAAGTAVYGILEPALRIPRRMTALVPT
jgi:hypothetical protein